jgi:hypothetical protein
MLIAQVGPTGGTLGYYLISSIVLTKRGRADSWPLPLTRNFEDRGIPTNPATEVRSAEGTQQQRCRAVRFMRM